MLLPFLILVSLGYVAFVVSEIIRERRDGVSRVADAPHPVMKFVFAGGGPLMATATMTYLFLIVGGATTVQLNVGSSSGMYVWSSWVGLWPMFLFITAAGALGSLTWLIVCAFKRAMRESIPASAVSLLLSVFTFFTVLSYFPSA